jgi:SAM-dependent methyltransferase
MPAERIPDDYVHGYSEREHARLVDQATTLTDLLHHDTRYPPGTTVLEAGCGVGAQTVTLARNSPGARFTCIDVSPRSLEAAQAHDNTPLTSFARRLGMVGLGLLRYGLVFLLVLWGGFKFASFEAEGIRPLISNSPFLSWLYAIFSVRSASSPFSGSI